jgi:hypothetical protein
LIGAKYIIGYALSGFGWMLDWEMDYKIGLHEIDSKLNIAKCLGADNSDREMDCYLSAKTMNLQIIFSLSGIATYHKGYIPCRRNLGAKALAS